jgi:hypothetical protein
MDQDRQIRFAVPPFLFFASLLWGAHLAGWPLNAIFAAGYKDGVIEVVAGGAAATVAAGYLISTVSVLSLRFLARMFGLQTYEARLSPETFQRVWDRLGAKQAKDEKLTLYVATTFDHELLDKGIHQWLFRRWNSFYVATNSIVALLLAHLVAPVLSIPESCKWLSSTVVVAVLLVIAAYQSWSETMKMFEFQSFRRQKSDPVDAKLEQTPGAAG